MYIGISLLLDKCARKVMGLGVLALLLLPAAVKAEPYLHILDLAHPHTSVGAFYDPYGRETPAYGTTLALVTHKAGVGGSIFKSLQADWTPMGVGAGYAAGSAFVSVGPSANMNPLVKGLALRLLDIVSKEGQYQNLRSLLEPPKDSGPDISVAFGPCFAFNPIEGGQALAPAKWKGRAKFFLGAAWNW